MARYPVRPRVVVSCFPSAVTTCLLAGLEGQGCQSAYLMTAISRTDYLSGNTSFHDVVMDNLGTVFTLVPTIDE